MDSKKNGSKKIVAVLDDLIEPLNEILTLLSKFTSFFKCLLIAMIIIVLLILMSGYWQLRLTMDLVEQKKDIEAATAILTQVSTIAKDTQNTVDEVKKDTSKEKDKPSITLLPSDAGVSDAGDNAVIVIEAPNPHPQSEHKAGADKSPPTAKTRVKVEIPVKLPEPKGIKVENKEEKK